MVGFSDATTVFGDPHISNILQGDSLRHFVCTIVVGVVVVLFKSVRLFTREARCLSVKQGISFLSGHPTPNFIFNS